MKTAFSLGSASMKKETLRAREGQVVVAGAIRVMFWGALAMAVTAGVGGLLGTVV
jgi:hypothetical protein